MQVSRFTQAKSKSKVADRSVRPSRGVFREEAVTILPVAEGFGTSGPGDGERAGAVAAGQAGGEVRSSQIFVQEAGVEAVPGADGVHGGDFQGGANEAFRASLGQRPL